MSGMLIPVPDWAFDLFPRRPLMFMEMPDRPYWYQHLHMPLRVGCSACVESDGRRWIHVSCSRPNRLPSWDELRLVKDTFVGRDRRAIQVLPRESEYVNIMPYCLHLWACLDDDGLPDFRKRGQI